MMGFESLNEELPPLAEVTEEEIQGEIAPESIKEEEVFRLTLLAEGVKKIGFCLSKRNADGLSDLMDRNAVGVLFSAQREMEESNGGGKDFPTHLQESISKLNYALDQFGKVPPERMVKEDSGSLRYLNGAMRGLADEVLSLKSLLGGKEKEEYDPAIRELNRCLELSQKVSFWLRKKADILEGRGK